MNGREFLRLFSDLRSELRRGANKSIATVSLICSLVCSNAQDRAPVTPADCVQIRYLLQDDSLRSPIVMDPTGEHVAYLVKSPNLATNENEIDLYLADRSAHGFSTPALLAHGAAIAQLSWIKDGSEIAFLMKRAGRVEVAAIGIHTGHIETLARLPGDITEYSTSADASVIVAAIDEAKEQQGNFPHLPSDVTHGYRIPYETKYLFSHPQKAIYLVRKMGEGRGQSIVELKIVSPLTGKIVPRLFCVANLRLSVSPDGHRFVITYLEHGSNVPDNWRSSPHVRGILERADAIQITAMIEIGTGMSSIPLATPWPYSVPLWSPDSRRFIEVGEPPIHSQWETREDSVWKSSIQMYSVNVMTGQVERVEEDVADPSAQPLFWRPDGNLILADRHHMISRLSFRGGVWAVQSQFKLPVADACHSSSLASDGTSVVGDCQTPDRGPEIFSYHAEDTAAEDVANLNPQLDRLSLAPTREIHWVTSNGYRASGLLVLPIGFREGVKYPLVVQTYPVHHGEFVCDSGESHDPASAPQPLANAGIMYLLRSRLASSGDKPDSEYYPQGYPGGIGEAEFQMDLADSAVEELIKEGMVEPAEVGIIGFSRSGWYVSFTLAHSKFHYAAATVSDGSQYTLGDYWLLHSESSVDVSDAMYGGPPYGASLDVWLKYSTSFNLHKITTPLLMEAMGYGVPYDNLNSPPLALAKYFEEFTALNRMGRPVDLYYYPEEDHQPDHPQARLASLTRNLDWYRFWLQGKEDDHPINSDQYTKWQDFKTRQLHDLGK